ncbi:hypothetical protein ELH54_23185 [Rhizobium ruizarguesonis]|nr:hypothetical protein ELH54_23185 [Rhizobium ruizarguesonis]
MIDHKRNPGFSFASSSGEPLACVIPGCTRPARKVSDGRIATFHCRYHIQHKSRHGSHWHSTYKVSELRPYVRCADLWIKDHRQDPTYRAAYWQLEYLLAGAIRVVPAMNLRGQSAEYRARIAFARLRAAEVPARRLVAIYLGVSALIEDDWKSHRVREFRIVQAAKAVHRLASGTHRKWDFWDPLTGNSRPYTLHAYPRSSGHVLRKIGEALEKACAELACAVVPEVIALRTERYGPHPSHPQIAKAS